MAVKKLYLSEILSKIVDIEEKTIDEEIFIIDDLDNKAIIFYEPMRYRARHHHSNVLMHIRPLPPSNPKCKKCGNTKFVCSKCETPLNR